MALHSVLAASALAAPPKVDHLFPAGGQRGTTVSVIAAGGFDRWPVQAWTDAAGISIKCDKEKGKLAITLAADAAPGIHWIRLWDEAGAAGLRPFVVGTLPEVIEAEPNDHFAKAQVISPAASGEGDVGAVVNGRFEKSGDVDCYSVRLKKGRTLVASLLGEQVLGSPMDAVLQVLSADGFVLEQNHDWRGLDPQIAFTAPADGTYVVRAFAFPSQPDATVGFAGGPAYIYRLTLTTGAFADHAFPLGVPVGKPATVQLSGWNLPDALRTLPVNTSAPGSVVLSHPLLANTVEVRAQAYPAITAGKPNDSARPQAVAAPVTISGCIDLPGSIDVYEFPAKKGQKLLLRVRSRELGFPLDPVLRVTDAAGKMLAEADDIRPPGEGKPESRDADLAFTAPAEGKYRVAVRDLHGEGGPRFAYRLDILPGEPDFEPSLTTDRFVLQPGKPLEIPVAIDRRNAFADEVEISATGLPAGVAAAPVRGKGAEKSVVLKLSSAAGPASGVFRIVAAPVGKPEMRREARSPIAGLTASTAELWLTILAPGAAPEAPRPETKKKR